MSRHRFEYLFDKGSCSRIDARHVSVKQAKWADSLIGLNSKVAHGNALRRRIHNKLADSATNMRVSQLSEKLSTSPTYSLNKGLALATNILSSWLDYQCKGSKREARSLARKIATRCAADPSEFARWKSLFAASVKANQRCSPRANQTRR